jgi:hypothetical protein
MVMLHNLYLCARFRHVSLLGSTSVTSHTIEYRHTTVIKRQPQHTNMKIKNHATTIKHYNCETALC